MKIEELIKTLVSSVFSYRVLAGSDDISFDEFIDYLQKKNVSTPNKGILNLPDVNLDQELTVHIGRLNRYAHSYIKTCITDLPFATDMDFAFTAILHQYGLMSKMDLVRKMVFEKSSGMEVIKRLLKSNIMEQSENPEDKRSKLLHLTEKGNKAILEAYQKVGLAAKTVGLPLTDDEKKILFNLLSKLDHFHEAQYLEGETNPEKILRFKS